MRHAKSDWNAEFDSDHDRPLNGRGVTAARLMGRMLTVRGLAPQLVISSSAARARVTAELAIESGGWTAPLVLDRNLYDSGVAGVIDVLSKAPEVDRLMAVGHQPTWSMTVEHLTGDRIQMRTACVAVIETRSDSRGIFAHSSCLLADLLDPKTVGGPIQQ